jgi:hypothetical protein
MLAATQVVTFNAQTHQCIIYYQSTGEEEEVNLLEVSREAGLGAVMSAPALPTSHPSACVQVGRVLLKDGLLIAYVHLCHAQSTDG